MPPAGLTVPAWNSDLALRLFVLAAVIVVAQAAIARVPSTAAVVAATLRTLQATRLPLQLLLTIAAGLILEGILIFILAFGYM